MDKIKEKMIAIVLVFKHVVSFRKIMHIFMNKNYCVYFYWSDEIVHFSLPGF